MITPLELVILSYVQLQLFVEVVLDFEILILLALSCVTLQTHIVGTAQGYKCCKNYIKTDTYITTYKNSPNKRLLQEKLARSTSGKCLSTM